MISEAQPKLTVRTDRITAIRFAVAVLLLSCPLVGCGFKADSTTPTAQVADDVLQVKTERGPLTATVSVSPKTPQLSDILVVTLTVTATDDIEVQLPQFQSAFDELVVRDFQDPLPTISTNQKTLKQIYKLEPLIAGELVIPAFTINYKDKLTTTKSVGDRDDGFAQLLTDELKFEVNTMVDAENLSLDAIKPAAAPIALPQPVAPFPLLQWLVAVASLLAAVTVWWIRSKKVRLEFLPCPGEIATKELDALVSDQTAREDLRNFYVQLTGIVRRYIEAVTGVQAAEQTTEEFLTEMQDKRLFSDSSNRRLQEFLETSDLIKFAGQTPEPKAVADSILAARQFIQLPSPNEARSAESAASNDGTLGSQY